MEAIVSPDDSEAVEKPIVQLLCPLKWSNGHRTPDMDANTLKLKVHFT